MWDPVGLWPVYAMVFFTVALAVWAVMAWWWPDPRQQRWQALVQGAMHGASPGSSPGEATGAAVVSWWQRHGQHKTWQALRRVLRTLGAWLAGPDATHSLRQQLQQAGWADEAALDTYRVASLLGLLVGAGLMGLALAMGVLPTWLSGSSWQGLAGLVLAAWAGLRSPQLLLHWRRQRRQREIFNAFAGALDLMRVCVQAGLGLDAAIDRVGRELRWSCPPLSQEFQLTGLALRAGAARAEALRQMAARIGLPEIDALVGLLVQSDRFGTPVSDTLRVHAQMLRLQRSQRAQAAAARLPVQLVIPLVFCVFPALLTVLLGPAVLGVMHNLLPSLTAR